MGFRNTKDIFVTQKYIFLVNTDKYVSLDNILKWDKILNLKIATLSAKKGELILEHGFKCDYFYFVSKGIVRAYYYDLEGNEVTHWFTSENMLITSPDSFFRNKENIVNIEALEDSELYLITRNQIDTILENIKGADKLFLNLIIDFTITFSDRVRSIHTESAEYRYIKLIQKHPNIFNKAKLSHIASYLGIRVQSLSRIRKRLIS